jgi:hypothetical protein
MPSFCIAVEVGLHRAHGEHEALGDLRVPEPARGQVDELGLARGQARARGVQAADRRQRAALVGHMQLPATGGRAARGVRPPLGGEGLGGIGRGLAREARRAHCVQRLRGAQQRRPVARRAPRRGRRSRRRCASRSARAWRAWPRPRRWRAPRAERLIAQHGVVDRQVGLAVRGLEQRLLRGPQVAGGDLRGRGAADEPDALGVVGAALIQRRVHARHGGGGTRRVAELARHVRHHGVGEGEEAERVAPLVVRHRLVGPARGFSEAAGQARDLGEVHGGDRGRRPVVRAHAGLERLQKPGAVLAQVLARVEPDDGADVERRLFADVTQRGHRPDAARERLGRPSLAAEEQVRRVHDFDAPQRARIGRRIREHALRLGQRGLRAGGEEEHVEP